MSGKKRNYEYGKRKRRMALSLALTLALVTGSFSGVEISVVHTEAAEKYGISNPRVEDGIATWDTVYFGNYWQEDTDGDGVADQDDEKQPIRWRVLSVEGDKALLLADKNLDCQPYNETYADVTWETCTLRSWLNGHDGAGNICGTDYSSGNAEDNQNFIDEAFSAVEQDGILTITVGDDEEDKLYLLTKEEVCQEEYGFNTDCSYLSDTRCAATTSYAEEQGVYISDIWKRWYENGRWWLSSTSGLRGDAQNVNINGCVDVTGKGVNNDGSAVRPALCLDLSSSYWTKGATISSYVEAGTGDITFSSDEGDSDVPSSTKSPAADSSGFTYAGNENASIVDAVRMYTTADSYDYIMQALNTIMSKGLPAETANQLIKDNLLTYGITDMKNGVQYARQLQKAKQAYATLTTNEMYTAYDFAEWYESDVKLRLALGYTDLFVNGEFFEDINPFTYIKEETPGIKKYKELLAEFIKEESTATEIASYTKKAYEFVDMAADLYSAEEQNTFKKNISDATTKDEIESLLRMYFNKAERTDDTTSGTHKWTFTLSEDGSDLTKALDLAGTTVKIAATGIEDIMAFVDYSANLNCYEENRQFLYDVANAGTALPDDMRIAAAQMVEEYESGYGEQLYKSLLDVVEISADVTDKVVKWKDTFRTQILGKGASEAVGSALGTLSLASVCTQWILKATVDVGEMTKKSADVRGYGYLSNFYCNKLAEDKEAFRNAETEENAWKFRNDYNILYRLRQAGENAVLDMYDLEGAVTLFTDFGFSPNREIVNKIKGYLTENAQFQFTEEGGSEESYRQKVIVDCPVDVEIYDSSGEKIYTLKDGEECEESNAYGKFVVKYLPASKEYAKVVYLKTDDVYEFKAIGNDSGDVTYSYFNDEMETPYYVTGIAVEDGSVLSGNTSSEKIEIDYDGDGIAEKQCDITDGVLEDIVETAAPVPTQTALPSQTPVLSTSALPSIRPYASNSPKITYKPVQATRMPQTRATTTPTSSPKKTTKSVIPWAKDDTDTTSSTQKGKSIKAIRKALSKTGIWWISSERGSGKVTLSLREAKGATGYIIKYATNRTMRRSKSFRTKKTDDIVIKKLDKGKYCYMRVRAYKKKVGRTIYGKWSKKVKIRIR